MDHPQQTYVEWVDALPYIDTIDAETSKTVDKLIAEEIERSEKKSKDYLSEMPPLGQLRFGGSVLLQEEYKRVKSGQPMPAMDTKRDTLPMPPIEKQNDPEAWKKAVENAQAQLEHARLRSLNAELASRYAPEAWKRTNELTAQVDRKYAQKLQQTKEEIKEINKKRKLMQTEVGTQLSKLEKEWNELVVKNVDILNACAKRRRTIQKLKEKITELLPQ